MYLPGKMDSFLTKRSIYRNDPPAYETRNDVNPTLLVSWWCTIFALTTILIRLFGRWIRTERLFREDKIMFWSIIPLLIRMGLVHVVLIYGTNNTTTDELTRTQIMHRETGARIVLAARILYAAFIWIAKLTVLEFLKRTIGASWAKSYEFGLRFIYGFLLLTFIGIIVGTLAECHPFNHYWQVVPDPGPQCREGLVQLLVMGVCDIVTDVVLIVFPIPVVLRSSMPMRKKFSLIALFLLSAILIAITAYRVPSTISRRSAQPYRSLLASLEILAAAFVANIVIIGSFIRDKGVKKAKFRQGSISAPSAEPSAPLTRTRTQSVTINHWGSDEDLVRDMGVALPTLLRSSTAPNPPRAAPMAPPGVIEEEEEEEEGEEGDDDIEKGHQRKTSKIDPKWGFTSKNRRGRRDSDSTVSSTSTDIKLRDLRDQLDDPVSPGGAPEPLTKQLSFFDVGGLVDKPAASTSGGNSREASIKGAASASATGSSQFQPQAGVRGSSSSKAFLSDIGGLLTRHKEEDGESPLSSQLHVQRESQSQLGHGTGTGAVVGGAGSTPRTPVQNAQAVERRKFSRSPKPGRMLESLRGENHSRNGSRDARKENQRQPPPTVATAAADDGPDSLSFGDIGGLLK